MKQHKTTKIVQHKTTEDVIRDGSALGVNFVIGNLLDKLRETYYHVNRRYVEKIDEMRKLNDQLRLDLHQDVIEGINDEHRT